MNFALAWVAFLVVVSLIGIVMKSLRWLRSREDIEDLAGDLRRFQSLSESVWSQLSREIGVVDAKLEYHKQRDESRGEDDILPEKVKALEARLLP